MATYSEWYTTNVLRRFQLLEFCETLPSSIVTKQNHFTVLLNPTTIAPSILDLWNTIFKNEDYWLRQTLEKEPSLYPLEGFSSLQDIKATFEENQGSLFTLCGLGPSGGWDNLFELPHYPEIQYTGHTVFWNFLLEESFLRGSIHQILLEFGFQGPPYSFL
ncbi:MAG: hypothetical protein N2450_01280 [bacterium]|nr:hypothetical protein [bacterium]